MKEELKKYGEFMAIRLSDDIFLLLAVLSTRCLMKLTTNLRITECGSTRSSVIQTFICNSSY